MTIDDFETHLLLLGFSKHNFTNSLASGSRDLNSQPYFRWAPNSPTPTGFAEWQILARRERGGCVVVSCRAPEIVTPSMMFIPTEYVECVAWIVDKLEVISNGKNL
jgi:hypothetical protein